MDQKQQQGGRLLGQGGFGCTFDPAPRCAGGHVFHTINGYPAVGKLSSEDNKSELAVGRALMSLPLAHAYFAFPTKECAPELPLKDPDTRFCKVYQHDKDTRSESDFSLMIMPNAGQTLNKYALDLPRLATTFKRIFIHMLEGAVIYQEAGYVHNDIHLGNVLVDQAGVARYIDVGLTFKVRDVRRWEDSNQGRTFKPKYVWQAPEAHAWRMASTGVRLAEGVKMLQGYNPEYLMLEHQFPARRSCYTSLSSFILSTKGMDDVTFIRTYGKKFDAWRIGFCMWHLWNDLLRWSNFMTSPLYGERDLMRRVIGSMTEFDPRARISVIEGLRLLDPTNRLASVSPPSS
jgi:serine/threonine protein kinase